MMKLIRFCNNIRINYKKKFKLKLMEIIIFNKIQKILKNY